MTCRICKNNTEIVLNLGKTPPANSLLCEMDAKEEIHPLVLEFCQSCSNVQLRDCLSIEKLYKNYFYETPKSSTLSNHYELLTGFLKSKNYMSQQDFRGFNNLH